MKGLSQERACPKHLEGPVPSVLKGLSQERTCPKHFEGPVTAVCQKDQATTKLVYDALRLRHEAYRFCGHSATCPRLAEANALLQSQPYCSHAVQSSRINNNQRGRDSCKRISLCVQRGSSCIQDPCLLMSKSYCRASAAGRTLPQSADAATTTDTKSFQGHTVCRSSQQDHRDDSLCA